jgi:hypothetical protein
MNKAINSFLKFIPNDEWIQKNSNLPWLKLDISVPSVEILKESDSLYSKAVTHRANDAFGPYTNTGWKSLTIYGESSAVTEQTDGPLTWTDIANECPATVEFIKQNWNIDQATGRIRFMWLEPQGYILPHADRLTKGLHEVNIAITQPNGCQFRFLDYGTVPFTSESAFLLDISNRHLVFNDSDQVRTHIIVHSTLLPGIIKSSYEQSFYS